MADSLPGPVCPVELTKKLKFVQRQREAEESVAKSIKKLNESNASAQVTTHPLSEEPKTHNPPKENHKPKVRLPPHPMKTRNRDPQPNPQPPTSHPKDSLPPSSRKNINSPPRDGPRPRHGPHRSRFLNIEDRDDSPDSQVIASGDCTPGSEGVRRKDRADVHYWSGYRDGGAELTPESRLMFEAQHGV
ncbi:MAG: hypothetical protein OHK93_005223 [Ramalina farinacea]|uniref:Uncharacterized protein n=1 Tax=Ramalina farinacea TaxID=258253 RepID=A0AA43QXF0_9LECA|nr:hypothetical protein [Ramalina farinacea]